MSVFVGTIDLEIRSPIVQTCHRFSQKSGHCIRLTVLQTILGLGEVLNAAQVEQLLAPTLLKALADPVPNVKYRACIESDSLHS